MKYFLIALAFLLIALPAKADYLGIKRDSNPEITMEDVIIKKHEITVTGTNCFSEDCAYEYYIRNNRRLREGLIRRGYGIASARGAVAIGIIR